MLKSSHPLWRMIRDKLKSYSAARREVLPSVTYSTEQYENNRAEVSDKPTRQRERQMRRFKSAGQVQCFLFPYLTAPSGMSSPSLRSTADERSTRRMTAPKQAYLLRNSAFRDSGSARTATRSRSLQRPPSHLGKPKCDTRMYGAPGKPLAGTVPLSPTDPPQRPG